MASDSASSLSSSSFPSHQQQPTISSAPLACLQVLQSSMTLSSMPAEGVCQLLKAMVAVHGQEAAVAMQALGMLRHVLDEVLEDGGSNGGERKRNRGTAYLEDNERQGAITTVTTFTTDRFKACNHVLQDPYLLTLIIGCLFHERHTGPSRVALGRTALVNKEWRHISRQTCFWQPLLRELRPVISDELAQGRRQENHFALLCKYGKCVVEKQLVVGDLDLFDGLELQMEVWNAGNAEVPSHCAVGPIQATTHGGATPRVDLRLCGLQRNEVAGPAFSATDLEPLQRRYPTIAECFNTAHEAGNPVHLCMRISVLDRLTGKMALMWSSGKETKYAFEASAEGTHYVVQPPAWIALHRRRTAIPSSSSAKKTLDEISAIAACTLEPLLGQEGVGAKEKKYEVRISPREPSSFASLRFKVPKPKTVAAFLRSLLH